MATTDKYDSPTQVKGKVTGVTKISGTAKGFALLGVLIVLGLIIFSIFTIDNDDSGAEAEAKKQEQKDNEKLEPARPYDGFDQIKPGQTSAPTPPELDDSAAAKDSAGRGDAPDLGKNKHSEEKPKEPTPEEIAKKKADALRDDMRNRAMMSEIVAKADTSPISKSGQGGDDKTADSTDATVKMALDLQKRMAALTGGGTPSDKAISDVVAKLSAGQDDPNKQIRKEAFMTGAGASARRGYVASGKQQAMGKYELKSTQIIPAMMVDALNSDLPQTIFARVTETVYDYATGTCPLIPQDTRVEGVVDSQVAFGQERIPVYWNKLIFRDGSTYFIDGMPGTDPDGKAGFTADVNNHYVKIFGGGVLLSVISTGAQLTDKGQNSVNGQPTVKSAMSSSLGQQISQTSTALIQKGMNIQPTLSRKVGTPFNIKITQDMIFPGRCGD